MIELTPVESAGQVAEVAALARAVWTEHYTPIIGPAQVAYMLERFQSERAIAAQLAAGYAYRLLRGDGAAVGYLATVPEADGQALFLSKLYVARPARGRGHGCRLLAEAEAEARARGLAWLRLTVNRHNSGSLAWYARRGFRQAGPVVQDIGGGFVMDDYRLEKRMAGGAGFRCQEDANHRALAVRQLGA